MRYALPLIVVICTVTVAQDADSPKSPLAVRAQQGYEAQAKWNGGRYEQAVKAAKAELQKATKESREEYVKQMKAALEVALKNKDLAEANRIDAMLKTEPPVPAANEDSRLIDQLDGTRWKMRGSPYNAHVTFRAIDMSVEVKETKNPGNGTWVVMPPAGIKKHGGKEGDVWIRVHRPALHSEVYKFTKDMKVMMWLDEKTYIWDRVD